VILLAITSTDATLILLGIAVNVTHSYRGRVARARRLWHLRALPVTAFRIERPPFCGDPPRGAFPLSPVAEAVSRRAAGSPACFPGRGAPRYLPPRRACPCSPRRGRSGRYFRSVFDQPQVFSAKPLILWRSLGDSNPCFRRERAKLARIRPRPVADDKDAGGAAAELT
jgi:hypothetical protein